MSLRSFGLLAAVLTLSGAAHAAMVSPTSGLVTQSGTVLVDTGYAGYSAHRLSNQSGLTLTYDNGVTDYMAYVGSDPRHNGTSADNGFLAQSGTRVDFDLGADFLVAHLALWNDNDYQGVRDFSVQVADNAAFVGASLVGEFVAQYGPYDYGQAVGVQTFDLADTTGRFVRVVFENNYGGIGGSPGNPYVNVGEVVFGVSAAAAPNAVAEPGSLALAGLALVAGMAAARRR